MKIKLLLLSSLLPFVHIRGSEPFDSYLHELNQEAADNMWWVFSKEINGVTVTPPKGGYLFRIKIDLNDDGVDDVFLTTDDEVTKAGESWTLYRGSTSGTYTKLNDNISLNGVLWVKTDGGVKKYSYVSPQEKDTGLESISTFWIDALGTFQTSTQRVTAAQSTAINGGDQTLLGTNGLSDANKIAQYLKIGTPVALSIQKALVGMLYQNTATWRAVNSNFTLSQQFLDPADAADIESLASWTPPSP